MITREKKKEIAAALAERFEETSSVYFINFEGLTVEDAIRMRRAFKEKEVKYQVAKNTLIKRALDEANIDTIPDEKLKLPTGLAFCYEDPVAPAKIIKKEFDENEKPQLKCCILEGRYYDGDDLKKLAALPTKEDIMGSIAGSVHSPISGIVGAINGVMRDLAYLVEEVAKKQAS